MSKLHLYQVLLVCCNLALASNQTANDQIVFVPETMCTNQFDSTAKKATIKSYVKIISGILGAIEIGSVFSKMITQQMYYTKKMLETNGNDNGAFVICTLKNSIKSIFALIGISNALYILKDGSRELGGDFEMVDLQQKKSNISNQVLGVLGALPFPSGIFSIINGIYRLFDSIQYA